MAEIKDNNKLAAQDNLAARRVSNRRQAAIRRAINRPANKAEANRAEANRAAASKEAVNKAASPVDRRAARKKQDVKSGAVHTGGSR